MTALLHAWGQGDEAALERLIPLVHGELRRIARRCMAGERVGHSLQATALVNEAYLRLVDQDRVDWKGRAHFFGIAAQAMRRILVDHARKRRAEKRGRGEVDLSFDDSIQASDERPVSLVALDDALKDLKGLDRRQHRIVELKYFGGLTIEEIAAVMEISPATVKREWATAKLWLARELARR